jgi:hypothetical protein
MTIINEIIEELRELASWEGCETGDLCHSLIDIYEGSASYASLNFQKALEKELLDLYNILKEEKAEDDVYRKTIDDLESNLIPRIKIVIDDVTFSFAPKTNVDPHRPEEIANALNQFVKFLKDPEEGKNTLYEESKN